jgi:hypothetical protein
MHQMVAGVWARPVINGGGKNSFWDKLFWEKLWTKFWYKVSAHFLRICPEFFPPISKKTCFSILWSKNFPVLRARMMEIFASISAYGQKISPGRPGVFPPF